MNASKEEARKANKELENAALLADGAVGNPGQLRQLKTHLIRVQDFIETAERKLPSESAYEAEADRRKAKTEIIRKTYTPE